MTTDTSLVLRCIDVKNKKVLHSIQPSILYTYICYETFLINTLFQSEEPPFCVQHILYLEWPDHGVPNSTAAVLEIFLTVSASLGPVVVHCRCVWIILIRSVCLRPWRPFDPPVLASVELEHTAWSTTLFKDFFLGRSLLWILLTLSPHLGLRDMEWFSNRSDWFLISSSLFCSGKEINNSNWDQLWYWLHFLAGAIWIQL